MRYRLSAIWMRDHLDVWPDGIPEPIGTFKGSVWVGELSAVQIKEIKSRCSCYSSREGICEDAWKYVDAAARVMRALGNEVLA